MKISAARLDCNYRESAGSELEDVELIYMQLEDVELIIHLPNFFISSRNLWQ